MMSVDKRRDAVAGELSAIANLSRADLVQQWVAANGRPPPKGVSRRLLEFSAAYALQTRALGGLKPSVRRLLERGDGGKDAAVLKRPMSKSPLAVGTRLVRDWHGKTHTVDVVEGGFQYDGREYDSLSRIAREITGTRWSGPRFFGL
jgi:hypothetical protein